MDSKKLYNKGLGYIKKGEYTKALIELDKAISLDSGDPDIFSDRGVTKFHLKNVKGALEDMNQSLKLDPENPYRYASRAYIRENLGDTMGAIEDYRKALELEPENAVTQNNLGMLEDKLGYLEIAKKRFQLADELSSQLLLDEKTETEHHRNKIVSDLLEELEIAVEVEKKEKSIFQQMISAFQSADNFKDYLKFVRNIFKRN